LAKEVRSYIKRGSAEARRKKLGWSSERRHIFKLKSQKKCVASAKIRKARWNESHTIQMTEVPLGIFIRGGVFA